MRAEMGIWFSLDLLIVVISSVRSAPIFSCADAIDLVGFKAADHLPERGAMIFTTSMFGQGLVIPFSPVQRALLYQGKDQITGQLQNGILVDNSFWVT
ncbi:MAG: hypothetical protein NTV68_01800 [Methanomicrobiales archaeon]|nr:hypothetical protein [Methanomicrobiales archaeon]